MSDLVGNRKDRFFQDTPHYISRVSEVEAEEKAIEEEEKNKLKEERKKKKKERQKMEKMAKKPGSEKKQQSTCMYC